MSQKTLQDAQRLRDKADVAAQRALAMVKIAVKSLEEGDPEAAHECFGEFDGVVNDCQEAELEALRILIKNQPTAEDARLLYAVLEITPHLERVARNSQKVAKAVIELGDAILVGPASGLPGMGRTALEMATVAIDGFVNWSVEGFDRLNGMDDTLDAARTESKRLVDEYLRTHPDTGEACIRYLAATRALERIGDHSCGMAEKVAFMVTGDHVAYNPRHSSDLSRGARTVEITNGDTRPVTWSPSFLSKGTAPPSRRGRGSRTACRPLTTSSARSS